MTNEEIKAQEIKFDSLMERVDLVKAGKLMVNHREDDECRAFAHTFLSLAGIRPSMYRPSSLEAGIKNFYGEIFEVAAICAYFQDLKVEEAIRGAKSTRGANKGKLKAKCPPVDTPEAAAWQAIMSHANPYKVGFGHMLLMSKSNRAIFDAIDSAIKGGRINVINLDRDSAGLKKLGAW